MLIVAARILIGVYVLLLGVFAALISTFLAITLSNTSCCFDLWLISGIFSVWAVVALVITFPAAYISAKYLEQRRA